MPIFGIFPFDELPVDSQGFDLGCGSGRWALEVAPRVGLLHCIDPSEAALNVERARFARFGNVRFHLASSDTMPMADDSQEFGYSLRVLHHILNTVKALPIAVRKLKPGAPFLLHIYFAMENRPPWYHWLWRTSEAGRHPVSRRPFGLRKSITTLLATTVYWPLTRAAVAGERMGLNVTQLPLAIYRRRACTLCAPMRWIASEPASSSVFPAAGSNP